MTYSLTRYKSYQDYLDDEDLSSDRNYRLLSTGEVIEVASEDDLNLRIAMRLVALLIQVGPGILAERIRPGNKEIEVRPVGDECINRKPDVMVVDVEHLEAARQAILLGMLPPVFVAEVVSPGPESSENYQRDYVWKREQYEAWQIPEYWILDPHQEKVTVYVLCEGIYKGAVYTGDRQIVSTIFPELVTTADGLLTGNR
ncbi:MAG: hypothetical protein DCF25_14550 [Leptolyngbya foveolarum]|uniref:Putative restriction endonuclease domain-containing protein n=1 Tax=Leptolyngbya foveolarum TaxID=47253 RepID=A0A2W4U0K3_9CYAN|nr:MAG: hypothetical protein DCF25_14550 [Leptolyngbya foveolarum]